MKAETRTQARNLYFQTNLSQSQIAKLLDVDRKTVYHWLKEGKWQQQKKLSVHMPSKIAEQYYYMLANMNHEILSREHQPYPLTHEAEQMRKVTLCLRNLKNRQTTNEAMESYTLLLETIQREDPELADKVNPYVMRQIQNRVEVKFADILSDEYKMDPTMDELYEYEIRPADDDDPTFTMPDTNPSEPDTPGGLTAPTSPSKPTKPVSHNNQIKTNIPMPQVSTIAATAGNQVASQAQIAATAVNEITAAASPSEATKPVPAEPQTTPKKAKSVAGKTKSKNPKKNRAPKKAKSSSSLSALNSPVSNFSKSLFTVLEAHSASSLSDLNIPAEIKEEIKTAAELVSKIIANPYPGLAQLFTAYLFDQLSKDPNQPRTRPLIGEDLLGIQIDAPETQVQNEIPRPAEKSALVAA